VRSSNARRRNVAIGVDHLREGGRKWLVETRCLSEPRAICQRRHRWSHAVEWNPRPGALVSEILLSPFISRSPKLQISLTYWLAAPTKPMSRKPRMGSNRSTCERGSKRMAAAGPPDSEEVPQGRHLGVSTSTVAGNEGARAEYSGYTRSTSRRHSAIASRSRMKQCRCSASRDMR
jgi:hypothetical protein